MELLGLFAWCIVAAASLVLLYVVCLFIGWLRG